MAKRVPGLPLSKLNAGLNRFDSDIGQDQSLEGEDVVSNKGYVRRREAFQSVVLGPVFDLPLGLTILAHTPVSTGITDYYYGQLFVIPAAQIGGASGDMDFFCEEKFDGISWNGVTSTLTTVTANSSLALKYLTSGGLVDVPWALDTTQKRFTNGSAYYHQTLCQQGKISWHRTQLTGWSTVSIGGRAYYQIRIGVKNVAGATPVYGGALSGTGNLQLSTPYPTAFITEPVRSIVPINILGAQQLLACADRQNPRGSELGAAIGVSKRERSFTRNAYLVAENQGEGAGIINQVTFPDFYRGNAAAHWRSGYVAAGGGPFTEGSSTHFTKNAENDPWDADRFRGAVIYESLSPFGGITNDTSTNRGGFTFLSNFTINPKQWEGLRIICTANGSGTGSAVGQEVMIVANTGTSLRYSPAFAAAPDTQNTFNIVRPHSRLILNNPLYDGKLYEIVSNSARALTFSAKNFADTWTTAHDYSGFQISREFQWLLRRGKVWNATFDTITKKYLLTNGESGLLEYDGNRFRIMPATFDAANARVQLWTGVLEDLARLNAQDIVAGSEVDVYPAKAKYVVDFNQRIVCASLQNAPYEVKWSAPNFFNDIWPKVYRASIRDAENNPITGMASLGNRLLVFTPTSIHEAQPADDKGMLTFRPIIQGVGFISNASVAKISSDVTSGLIGAAADGVYVVAGTSVINLVDQWDRYLPQGVNSGLMSQCCGDVSFEQNLYFLALPGAGSKVNNKILAINLASRAVQVWNAPWGGISSIKRDTDEYGRERILFGTNDGHIAILAHSDTDDSDTVTGWARSGPLQLDGTTMAFTSMEVSAVETGTQTLTIKSFVDRKGAPKQEASLAFASATPVYGTDLYGTALWAGENQVKTRKVMLPAGTRGESFQFEIRGTGQWQFKQADLVAKPMGQRSK